MRSKAFYLLAVLLILPVSLWMAGCAGFEGDVRGNVPPVVDFVNVHADYDTVRVDVNGDPLDPDTLIYDYAPVIYWKGSDEDGFIEYYSYADITDAAAIENPIEFMPRIPQEAWIDTIATEATIFLLSEEDEVTEHVFYVRAFDDKGAESAIKYRRFYRTNNAPTIPRIGITGVDEENFSTRYVVEDTLFTSPAYTTTYTGIQFSWRGSDPDDKALFTIPLEFQQILVKSPAETVFVSSWSEDVETALIDLETGFYTLNVWARDDGLTKSVAPARAEFNVIRPTFENNLLVVLESPITGFNTFSNPPSRENVRAYYESLLANVAPHVTKADLNMEDGIDVRFHEVQSQADAVSRSLISQYKMVAFIADHLDFNGAWPDGYVVERKQPVVEDYLRVGGRVWQTGRSMSNTLKYGTNIDGLALYEDFFSVDSLAMPPDGYSALIDDPPYIAMRADFVRTLPALQEFPVLHFDDSKILENGISFGGEPIYFESDTGMTGVDRLLRNYTAETTQQFYSATFGQEIFVEGEDAIVLGEGEDIDDDYPNIYPATATNAFLAIAHENVNEVTSIINVTFMDEGKSNYIGQPVYVNNDLVAISYDEGDQWRNDDVLEVDYSYNPISVMHLKPVEIRVETSSGGNQLNPFAQLRYRTAVSTFAYYFIVQEEAEQAWIEMLNWFLNPNLNDATFDF